MTNKISLSRKEHIGALAAAAVIAAGLTLASYPALAQDNDTATAQPGDEINVVAPGVISQTVGRSRTTGAPIDHLSVSREVRFSDLDLSKREDAATLRSRVRATAVDLCREIHQFHLRVQRDANCVQQTTAAAMRQAQQAIQSKGGG